MDTPVIVFSVAFNPANPLATVYLWEVGTDRYFPFVTGRLEAEAIARKAQHTTCPRPATYDWFQNVLTALGGRATKVVIHDIQDGVFHTRLVLDDQGRHVEVDSRPSDAVALALCAGAPICVADDLFERFGVNQNGQPVNPARFNQPAQGITEEQAGPFSQFINALSTIDTLNT